MTNSLYTVFVRRRDGVGTTYIGVVSVPLFGDLAQISLAAVADCAETRNERAEDLVCVGACRGDMPVIWDDDGLNL